MTHDGSIDSPNSSPPKNLVTATIITQPYKRTRMTCVICQWEYDWRKQHPNSLVLPSLSFFANPQCASPHSTSRSSTSGPSASSVHLLGHSRPDCALNKVHWADNAAPTEPVYATWLLGLSCAVTCHHHTHSHAGGPLAARTTTTVAITHHRYRHYRITFACAAWLFRAFLSLQFQNIMRSLFVPVISINFTQHKKLSMLSNHIKIIRYLPTSSFIIHPVVLLL